MQSALKARPSSSQHGATNPLARALAETEKSFSQPNSTQDQNSLFGQALAQSGGRLTEPSFADAMRQQESAKKQEYELKRQKLHEQINPVDMTEIFSAREKQAEKKLNETRKEIEALGAELKPLKKELDIAASQMIVDVGMDGTGYSNWLDQLRQYIQLCKMQVHSAAAWLRTANSKSAKRRAGKFSTGVDFSGKGYKETTAVFDTMHHERSSSYAGA